MTIAGQLVVGALIVVAFFAVNALVEIVSALDLGAVALCAIFVALATVALVSCCRIAASR